MVNDLGNKEAMAKNIQRYMDKNEITRADLSELISTPYTTICSWLQAQSYPRIDKIEKMAQVFGCSKADLVESYLPEPSASDDIAAFRVIGEVAAGYNHIAYQDWEGVKIDIPRSYLHGRPEADYFALKVTGDSMFPYYMDGDIVLVLRQNTLTESGEIGVVLYESEFATLKKVEFNETHIKLVPINPNYPPVNIEHEDMEKCKILGIPKVLIRES